MLICFDTKTKELQSIVKGNNPIPPFDENISFIETDDQNFILKRGDIVYVNDNYVKIGSNKIKIKRDEYTIITMTNYLEPILLEEL